MINTSNLYTTVIIKLSHGNAVTFFFCRTGYTKPIGFLMGYTDVTNLNSDGTCTYDNGTIIYVLGKHAIGYLLYYDYYVESINYL